MSWFKKKNKRLPEPPSPDISAPSPPSSDSGDDFRVPLPPDGPEDEGMQSMSAPPILDSPAPNENFEDDEESKDPMPDKKSDIKPFVPPPKMHPLMQDEAIAPEKVSKTLNDETAVPPKRMPPPTNTFNVHQTNKTSMPKANRIPIRQSETATIEDKKFIRKDDFIELKMKVKSAKKNLALGDEGIDMPDELYDDLRLNLEDVERKLLYVDKTLFGD